MVLYQENGLYLRKVSEDIRQASHYESTSNALMLYTQTDAYRNPEAVDVIRNLSVNSDLIFV